MGLELMTLGKQENIFYLKLLIKKQSLINGNFYSLKSLFFINKKETNFSTKIEVLTLIGCHFVKKFFFCKTHSIKD